MEYLLIILVVFVLSFIFSMGGVGSATAIIPTLVFLGEDFNLAKNAGLFINSLSSSMSTYHHHQKGKMEWKLALSLALPSIIMAPAGALFSQYISRDALLLIFSAFLIYSATVLLFLKKSGDKEPVWKELSLVGTLAGFFAGLLGIGGGAIISPILVLMGVDTKRIARLTPFAVLLSSLSGFFTYAYMGYVDLELLAVASVPAIIGGYAGAHMMHHRLSDRSIKIIIGGIFYLLAVKAILHAI